MRQATDIQVKLRMLIFVLGFMGVCVTANGQGPGAGKEITPMPKINFAGLHRSVDTSLEVEQQHITGLIKERELSFSRELNAYRVQLSIHANLINKPDVSSDTLENAFAVHRIQMEDIAGDIKDFIQKRDDILQQLAQAEEQVILNEKQIEDMVRASAGSENEAQAMVEKIQILIHKLIEKTILLEDLKLQYDDTISLLTETGDERSQLTDKFIERIQKRKKQEIFSRKDNPLMVFLMERFKPVSKFSDWRDFMSKLWRTGGFQPVSGFVILGAILIAGIRLRRYVMGHVNTLEAKLPGCPWTQITVQILARSLLLLTGVLVLLIVPQIHDMYNQTVFQLIFQIVLIGLFAKWGRDFILTWNRISGQTLLADKLAGFLNRWIQFIAFLAIIHVILLNMTDQNSTGLMLVRMGFETLLLFGCIRFWRTYRILSEQPLDPPGGRFRYSPTIRKLCYFTIVTGFIADILGYGTFAVYWYAAWGKTMVVMLWGMLIFNVLRELNLKIKETAIPDTTADSGKWLLIRFCWPLWLISVVIGLIVAWGGKQSVVFNLLGMLRTPIPIGGMAISLLGFAYAFILLSLLHVATQLWKQKLADKIFPDRMDRGLRNSITSISIYLFWGLGILLSLGLIGVSTASLTVIFGALSVGLGFGLQNIFNNFVSGIILLFERPIQIGDVVEINNIWGEVKKINIRSTHVQTYDNASLIIPNSQFISNQVINWSFKDANIRRQLHIGVAYGSDIEQVRDTLLEAANNTLNVLTLPVPNVVFMEFGDSALIFRLRYWTHVDFYYTTQTDILFEVNRLFRERGIDIPFPQRDIHIKSVDNGTDKSLTAIDNQ